MDLPQRELGVAANDAGGFDLKYVVLDKKGKTIDEIVQAAKGAEIIYLAPDPDREGEIIAWHVAKAIHDKIKSKKDIRRIAFNEITKSAVTKAIENPGSIDEHKVDAQQARRVLDRWVGYEVSPILWRKVSKGLSAGRVQSVALKLICDREEAIRQFKPEEYWTIDAAFDVGAKIPLNASLIQIDGKKAEITNEKDATQAVAGIKKAGTFIITAIKDSKRQKNASAPFMTSTLQQAAYNQLSMNVDKTMQIAQQLYEGIALDDASPTALITYMRTDSQRIAASAIDAARSFIDEKYGSKYLPETANIYEKSTGQDAHEAIRPIDIAITPEFVKKYADKDTARLYELIWKRFVACQMSAALYAQRQVTLDGGVYTFRATGSTLLFDGFLKVYQVEEEDDQEGKAAIPDTVAEKLKTTLQKIDPVQHFTQPPPRFSQATLVKELEKEEIGRPSTYATILKTIQQRAYTRLEKKRFVPTELGMAVTKLLTENLPKIMNVKFTAVMEQDLDKIAQGELERDTLLKTFYEDFEKDLEAFRGEKRKSVEPTSIQCPQCKNGFLLVRFGKSGPFVGCEKYPECNFTSNFVRNEDGSITVTIAEKPKELTEKCPDCGKNLRVVNGRYGEFTACSGYPDCKYIKQIFASFPCPQSGGKVMRRMWKGKVFWGCSDYPNCKYSISGDIEDTPCPQCKAPYLLKAADGSCTCSNKECSYTK